MSDAPTLPGTGHGKILGMSPLVAAAVAAGGIGAAFYFRRSTAPIVPATPVALDNTQPGAGNLAIGAAASNPTSAAPYGDAAPVPTSNSDWSVLAQRVLIGLGYDPVAAQQSVGAYLNGDPLSAMQRAIVAIALGKAGPAPEYVPPPPPGAGTSSPTMPTMPPTSTHTTSTPARPAHTTAPPVVYRPPVVSTPKPVTHTTYTVAPGDSLSVIAARYGMSWQSLYSANHAIVGANPNLIRPGQKLVIR